MATAYLASYINVFETAKASRRGSVADGDRLLTEETAGAQAQSRGSVLHRGTAGHCAIAAHSRTAAERISGGQLLEDYEVAETQLEGKTRESEVCIWAQQTAQHELRLCTVRFP